MTNNKGGCLRLLERYPSIVSFLIGAQTLIFPGLVGALNVQMGELFNKKYYNILMIVIQTPSFVLGFFVPYLLKNLGYKKANYYNFSINTLCNLTFASVFLMGMYVPNKAFIFLCIIAVISRASNGISEIGLMSMTETMGTNVQMMFVAGGSASNLVVAGVEVMLTKLNLTIENFMLVFPILPVVYNILAFIMYLMLDKLYRKKESENKNGKTNKLNAKIIVGNDKEEKKVKEGGILVVLKQRWRFLLLLSLMFFCLNLVYPNLMYKANDNSVFILFVYGLCEFSARLFNAFLCGKLEKKGKSLKDKINARCTTIFILFYCLLCFSAFMLYYFRNSLDHKIKVILVYSLYAVIAIGHGFLGSVLCSHITGGFKLQGTKNAANTLYIAAITSAILFGSLAASIIDNALGG